MKILFYAFNGLWFEHLGVLLDEAIRMEKEGNEVLFAYNDCSMGICTGNLRKNRVGCKYCHLRMNKGLRLLPKSIKKINIKDYWIDQNHSYTYRTVDEIKQIEYKNVKVGYAVMASYISMTRNMCPAITKESKLFFDKLISTSCNLTDALDRLIDDVKPNKMYFFNARFFEWRPPYDLAMSKGIDAVSLERKCDPGVHNVKVYFINQTPHSIDGNQRLCTDLWNNVNLSEEEKIRIGKEFFEKRRAGVRANDKVYIGLQQKGKLPEWWDVNKRNIVIFNSSEDEFAAIGEEYKKLSLFNSQYQGVKYILDTLKDEKDVHVYLRVHPNLGNVSYRYHTELVKFEEDYENVTVIPAKDSVSSYTLLDNAEKIVVFGSTMGVESVYWGKPVILLSGTSYYYSNICYIPKSKDELHKLLLSNLKAKNNEEAIKWGFYFMYRNPEDEFDYIDYDYSSITLLGTSVEKINYMKLFGSSKLYALYTKLYIKMYKTYMKIRKIPEDGIQVPLEEDLNALL